MREGEWGGGWRRIGSSSRLKIKALTQVERCYHVVCSRRVGIRKPVVWPSQTVCVCTIGVDCSRLSTVSVLSVVKYSDIICLGDM